MSYWDDFNDETLVDDDPTGDGWGEYYTKRQTKPKKKKPKHQRIASFEVDGFIDFDGKKYFAKHRLLHIHPESSCRGRACVIHAPSAHGMRDLPLIWDSVETQMHRLCSHDLTHPDPDDLAYWVTVANKPWKSLHDCCPQQCCNPLEKDE